MPCCNGRRKKWHRYGTRTSILCRARDLHETHPPWMPIFYLQLYIMIFHIKAASSPLSALVFISQFPPLPPPPLQRVSVINMSEEEIIELLSSHGIHKRSAETPEDEGGEEEQERQEL